MCRPKIKFVALGFLRGMPSARLWTIHDRSPLLSQPKADGPCLLTESKSMSKRAMVATDA